MSSSRLAADARAVVALVDAAHRLRREAPRPRLLRPAVRRGWFRPAEEERLVGWFARFLTVRESLWQVVEDGAARLGDDPRRIRADDDRRLFVLTYAAACALVGLDRLLVDRVAIRAPVQRKLNEGCAELRIPRKQFTAVLESLSDPEKALRIRTAMRWRDAHRRELAPLADCPLVGAVYRGLPRLERTLDPSMRRFFRLVGRYLGHAFRRRGASARQQLFFGAIESTGRLASELRDPFHRRRLDDATRARLAALLRPGDVLVTRRDGAFTNLFLPGHWPHAAFYVGTVADRRRLGVALDGERAARWSEPLTVLEALKDGVLFRPLQETLDVDAVAVLRPRLGERDVARAIERAAAHEGKLYNFDFDFFRTDRLVCTEVVYRAYDGLGDFAFELTERSGRPTFAAEDLLDLALDGRGFDAVAVFGAPSAPSALLTGDAAVAALATSYERAAAASAPA